MPRDRARAIESARKWALANPEKSRLAHRRYDWKVNGMSPDKAQTVYDSVTNCEICGDSVQGRNKHVDHNKESGYVRGVLCNSCNHLLGNAKEDIIILQRASEYLTRKSRQELVDAAAAIGAPSYVSFDGKGT